LSLQAKLQKNTSDTADGWDDFDFGDKKADDKPDESALVAQLEQQLAEKESERLAGAEWIKQLESEVAKLKQAGAASSQSKEITAPTEGWDDFDDFGEKKEDDKPDSSAVNSKLEQQLAQIKQLEDKCARVHQMVDLPTTVSKLEEQLSQKEQEKKSMEQRAKQLEDEVARLQQVPDLSTVVSKLEEQLSQKDQEKRSSEERVKQLEDEVTRLQQAPATSTEPDGWDDFDFEAEDKPDLAALVTQLETKLAEKQQQQQDADQVIKSSEARIENLEAELKKLQESHAAPAKAQGKQDKGTSDLVGGWDDFDDFEADDKPDLSALVAQLEQKLASKEQERQSSESHVKQLEEEVLLLQQAAVAGDKGKGKADELDVVDGWDDFDDFDDKKAESKPDYPALVAELEAKLSKKQQEHEHTVRVLKSESENTQQSSEARIKKLEEEVQEFRKNAAAATKPVTTSRDLVDGWDDFDDFDDKKAIPAPATPDIKQIQVELAKAAGRVSHLEDQLKAERAAHGDSVTKKLRAEIKELSEALLRERQDREREETHLADIVRQAQEDLKRQAAIAATQAAGRGHSEEAEIRAKNIARLIAEQTSELTDELHRLRGCDPERTLHQAPTHGVQPTDELGPERTLHQAPTHGVQPTEELGGLAPEVDAPPDSWGLNDLSHELHDRSAAPSHTTTQHQDVDGEESHVPRPPDEVTSGWDVFDPDDQPEHTIPVAPRGQDPWGLDTDLADLVGPPQGAPSTSNATAPELSPASAAEADVLENDATRDAWDVQLDGLL